VEEVAILSIIPRWLVIVDNLDGKSLRIIVDDIATSSI
jgi:hypothetical protein